MKWQARSELKKHGSHKIQSFHGHLCKSFVREYLEAEIYVNNIKKFSFNLTGNIFHLRYKDQPNNVA
jgi:hypothetical protein